MKKIYHLGTCSTCQRIIKELDLTSHGFEFQDIKTEKITEDQIDEMKEMSGSFESIFSRRAMKFRSMGLHEKNLNEQDYRKLILEEYTFLKRPVVLIDNHIFIGNSKKTVSDIQEHLNK